MANMVPSRDEDILDSDPKRPRKVSIRWWNWFNSLQNSSGVCDFLGGPQTDISNATGDGTTFNLNSTAFDFDRNIGGNVVNGIFTAPTSGFYELETAITLANLGAGHTSANLLMTCSGGTGLVALAQLNPVAIAVSGFVMLYGRVRVNLLKNNTAWATVVVSGSTKTVSVISGSSGNDWQTRFSGRLVS